MSYQIVAPNTTWCPDTPENHREFDLLKARILESRSGPSDLLKRQIAKENKQLRSLRTFLPGHEPDR